MRTQRREPFETERAVRALMVPSGEEVQIEAGCSGILTQALGASYTVYIDGQLFRIDGSDGDAIGQPVHEPTVRPADASDEQVSAWIWDELREVYDPEIPCSIVDLGLVYRCEIKPRPGEPEGKRLCVEIDMTVTAPGCGMGEQMGNEVADRVLALPGVGEVKVEIVFDPPWDRSMMSEEARLSLGLM